MDRALLVDLYELTMAQGYFCYKSDSLATFDLFVRGLPQHRNYLVVAGVGDILRYLEDLRFTSDDLKYLKSLDVFSRDFLDYLASFRFKGDLWAMPEGQIFFANEPIIRVTAGIIEAQIIESFLLNTINLQSMIASKAARVVSSAEGRKVYDFSLRRTHGAEAGLKASRSCFIAGASGTSCVLAAKLYGIPAVGTMAHSFVQSFKKELDSFLAYAETFPSKTILLVDTYKTRKGIENAVTAGLYLKEKGYSLQGIRLDSGDIISLSKFARKKLDEAGLGAVKILASGNLDEFKIEKLIQKGARVDSFGVGTNMGVSFDAPSLDVIYKMSEISSDDGLLLPTMKLSKAKATYPGKKQVFRVYDKNGKSKKDIIGLEKEKIGGRPLLRKIISRGKVVYQVPGLEKTRSFFKHNLDCFSPRIKDLGAGYIYPVEISPGLLRLRREVAKSLEGRQ